MAKYTIVLRQDAANLSQQISKLKTFLADSNLAKEDGRTLLLTSEKAQKQATKEHEDAATRDDICVPTAEKTVLTIPNEAFESDSDWTLNPELVLFVLKQVFTHNADKPSNDKPVEDIPSERIILFPHGNWGDQLAARLGARLAGSSLIGIVSLEENADTVKGTKKVYSGHLSGTFEMQEAPFCFSVYNALAEQYTNDAPATLTEAPTVQKTTISGHPQSHEILELPSVSPLKSAGFVMACGQGMKNKAGVDTVKEAAEKLQAVVGGSRPTVMSAWLPMTELLGVSGNMIHPELCLTLGVSGAPAFYAGIEQSKTIVAVNNDPNAPIFGKADAGICEDWKEFLSALTKMV